MKARVIAFLAFVAPQFQVMTADDLGQLTAPPPEARTAFGDDPLKGRTLLE